ncbi:MAG: asparagine synthase (glutamine-hydrolyzing) [Planctomycetes bacterium]|nr:asparagine synthase (glutamine-hydrolyzing) [Planctomycetota bacterium]
MCGITGILRFDGAPIAPDVLKAMTDALAHRGPDGEGAFLAPGVALGHRRLAIIDLEGGRQPMADTTGRYQIVFNGEIYNYQELRAELEQAGCAFATRSDTEVVIQAYARWGPDCVRHLRGMFAFCVVDLHRRVFLIARDHFGIKPLLYAQTPDQLAFASEFSALRALPGLKLEGELAAIEWFLRLQYIPGPATVFRQIRKLPPGHLLAGPLDRPPPAPARGSAPRFAPDTGRSHDQWLEHADDVIRQSVRAHLIADVPVGVFVSGGIDSSLVAAKVHELGAGPRYAFSIGFADEQFSELGWARQLAAKLGIELITDTAGEDFWEHLPQLVRHYGEPFGDNSMIPTWQLARLARRHVAVCLSGDAGDENFGGYGSYLALLAVPRLKEYWRRLKSRLSRAELGALLWALGRKLGGAKPRLSEWQRTEYVGRDRRARLWRPELRRLADAPCPAMLEADARAPRHGLLDYAQFMDFQTYLPGAILTKVDIATMYHGLEARTPLLDREVHALACALPAPERVRGNEGKAILKDILARLMGPEFVSRPKQGFGIPRRHWFRADSPGRRMFDQVVFDPACGLDQWFDLAGVRQAAAEHGDKRDRSAMMWLLLVLGLWRRQNPDLAFAPPA